MAARYFQKTGATSDLAVAILAEQGDSTAYDITTSSALALGRALAQIACVLDPTAFVLGGGLGTSQGLWRTSLEAAYAKATRARPNPPSLLTATLGEDSGAVGAALAAIR